MAYTWSSDLETGNIAIDTQHRELINAINKLLEACSAGQGRTQVADTSKFLLDYTKRHFADEETLQRKTNYPDYINHKKYHESFIQVVTDLNKALDKDGPSIVIVSKINTAVAGWLLNHIKKEDVKVAAHIKQAV